MTGRGVPTTCGHENQSGFYVYPLRRKETRNPDALLTRFHSLTWSLVEAQHFEGRRRHLGKDRIVRFGGEDSEAYCGACLTCGVQRCAIFSMLNPPLPERQIGDCIGPGMSAHVHHLGNALGPRPAQLVRSHSPRRRLCSTSCRKLAGADVLQQP